MRDSNLDLKSKANTTETATIIYNGQEILLSVCHLMYIMTPYITKIKFKDNQLNLVERHKLHVVEELEKREENEILLLKTLKISQLSILNQPVRIKSAAGIGAHV